MKIAIVAPSPVPYAVGGAEKLWWGLLGAINQQTNHQVELIKLPSPENNFRELMASYKMFSELNLDHFDQIISTKYPAWMVQHPNHHCYLQHKLRGLYDTYHFCKQPKAIPSKLPAECNELRRLLASGPDRSVLPDLWQELDAVLALARQEVGLARALAFPGPLTRAIVHFLDDIALHPSRIRRFSAISRNVAGREGYFPKGCPVQVIHHPSDIEEYSNTGYDHIFTISRLDGPKRIRLLVEAFLATDTDREFRIAGTGPEAESLKELAQGDSRVRFLGRITDSEVVRQYAGALFVPFIPYDEDYGLITVEAMASGKAVLTTTDAGGVNEFVENAVSGYSVAPDVKSLTRAMQTLLDDEQATRQMGEKAKQKVAHISWPNTLAQLLPGQPLPAGRVQAPTAGQQPRPKEQPGPREEPRPKIVVAVNFPVWPPAGGGQSRVYYLYKAMARHADITLVTQAAGANPALDNMIAPGLREMRVAKSKAQMANEKRLATLLNASVEDIATIQGIASTPRYLEVLQQAATGADLVIASHPYLFAAINSVYSGELWYEAHNVEYDMKQAVLDQANPNGLSGEQQGYLDQVRQIESDCIAASSTVLACSREDLQRLAELYALDEKEQLLVPNGVCFDTTRYADAEERRRIRTRMATQQRFQVLFMGSWHGPNIEAMERIVNFARECTMIDFLIIGSLCRHPVCQAVPGNIYPLGVVSNEEKAVLLNSVDLAINPMLSGSGTNLKMLDYAASGTPILTTAFGNRGLTFKPGEHLIVAESGRFPEVLASLYARKNGSAINTTQPGSDPLAEISLDGMARRAYDECLAEYGWDSIARIMLSKLSCSTCA
ncbi:MAG: glycosyltransferase [Proteobacteria bacterium]|nr:MAG: glycosyltransferase [Pseudomonadota bacterium]